MIDVERVKRAYRRNVRLYDAVLQRPMRQTRERAIAALALRPGETVLDMGCGTGLSFTPLQEAVGPHGHIFGVELSPEMLGRARERALRHGWTNVTLVEANAEEVDLAPRSVDAVLCFYTHDIMNSRPAVERAIGALRPAGRIVAAGAKQANGVRGVLLNAVTFVYSLPFVTNTSGTARPWAHLEDLIGPMEIEERLWGSAYIASGKMPGSVQYAEDAKLQTAR